MALPSISLPIRTQLSRYSAARCYHPITSLRVCPPKGRRGKRSGRVAALGAVIAGAPARSSAAW